MPGSKRPLAESGVVRTHPTPGRMWSLGWVTIIRLIVYLVIIAFFLQHIYFHENVRYYRPGFSIGLLVGAFLVNCAILLLGRRLRWLDQLIALTYVIDLIVLTRIIIASGGFYSVFIPYYLPILVMSAAWLPRRLTAVFPSIATLGVAYIGLAYLQRDPDLRPALSFLYNQNIIQTLPHSPDSTVVSTMLILSVLFFVVSYVAGILSERLFVERSLNDEILASMREGVAVVNRQGKLVFANAEFLRLYPNAVRGDDFRPVADELLPGPGPEENDQAHQGNNGNHGAAPASQRPQLDALLDRAVSGDIFITEEVAADAGRPATEVRVSGIRLGGSPGLVGLLFLLSDLTLRKRMERAERNLERTSVISTMAAGLAHEIRNPLAAVRSAIQEIGQCFPKGSQNRLLTDIVISESDRLDGVISRFLDFSREGRLRLTQRHLGPLLREVVAMVRQGDRPDRDCRFEVDIKDDPEVLCDPDRLKEIFLNLVLNACQAAPAREGWVGVALGREIKGGQEGVTVEVADNGPGLSEEALAGMFKPFFTEKPGGTGMGLPLSRKQAMLHGGDLDGENRLQGGALFRVWLPLDGSVGMADERFKVGERGKGPRSTRSIPP